MSFRTIDLVFAITVSFMPMVFALSDTVFAQSFIPIVIGLSSLVLLGRALSSGIPVRQIRLLLCGIAVCILYGVVAASSSRFPLKTIYDIDFLKILGRLSLMPFVLVAASLIDWTRLSLYRSICVIGPMLLLIGFAFQALNGFQTGNVVLEMHSNFLGFMGYLAIMYAWSFRLRGRSGLLPTILALSGLLACLSSVSRAAYVGLVTTILFYTYFQFLGTRLITALPLFALVLATAIGFSLNWADWVETPTAEQVSKISERYLDKPLDTGRAKFWHNAEMTFQQNFWLGTGAMAHDAWTRRLANGKTIKLSVHNYYYAVLHETGVIGLSILLCFFCVLACMLVSRQRPRESALGLSVFFTILIHQITEVSLTTGTFTLGAAMWCFLGCMLSNCHLIANRTQDHEVAI